MRTHCAYWISLLVVVVAGLLNVGGFWVIRSTGQLYPRFTPFMGAGETALGVVFAVVSVSVIIRQKWEIGILVNLVMSHLFLFCLAAVFALQWYFYTGTLANSSR